MRVSFTVAQQASLQDERVQGHADVVPIQRAATGHYGSPNGSVLLVAGGAEIDSMAPVVGAIGGVAEGGGSGDGGESGF